MQKPRQGLGRVCRHTRGDKANHKSRCKTFPAPVHKSPMIGSASSMLSSTEQCHLIAVLPLCAYGEVTRALLIGGYVPFKAEMLKLLYQKVRDSRETHGGGAAKRGNLRPWVQRTRKCSVRNPTVNASLSFLGRSERIVSGSPKIRPRLVFCGPSGVRPKHGRLCTDHKRSCEIKKERGESEMGWPTVPSW